MATGLLLMFGPPQSGKGTYGKRLSRMLGIPFVSAGESIRKRLREDEAWFGGRYSMELHDQGEFCPPDLVRALVEDLVGISSGQCILDGYPRNSDQFADLMEMGLPFTLIHLDIPEDELVRRASGRRVCSDRGTLCGRGGILALPRGGDLRLDLSPQSFATPVEGAPSVREDVGPDRLDPVVLVDGLSHLAH